MSTRKLSVHTEHEFLLKMEMAGLNELLAQDVIQSKGNKLAERIVAYIRVGAPEIELRKREVWKTIKLGTGLKTAKDFVWALDNGGFKLSDWAKDILGKPAFTAADEEIELDLVKVTVGELGFKSGARRDKIYERAKQLGLELCPAEVGPQLRLQYKDQPNSEWVLIGMEPIPDSDGDLRVFHVECSASELWLCSHYGPPDDFWFPGRQWVFVRPRR